MSQDVLWNALVRSGGYLVQNCPRLVQAIPKSFTVAFIFSKSKHREKNDDAYEGSSFLSQKFLALVILYTKLRLVQICRESYQQVTMTRAIRHVLQ